MTITTREILRSLPDSIDANERQRLAQAAFEMSTLCSEAQQAARDLIEGDLEAAYYGFDRAIEDMQQMEDAEAADTCAWLRDSVEALQP